MAMLLTFVLSCSSGIESGKLGPDLGRACNEGGCRDPYVCGHDAVCVEVGTIGSTARGDDCSDSIECGFGLVCSGENVCVASGSDGTAADGDACSKDADCQAGHYCDGGSCVDAEIPFFEGGACPPDDTEGPFRPLFQLPDLPVSGTNDFYSFPFPNDLRAIGGHPDLSGHPDPGDDAPAVGLLFSAIAGQTGFGLNPTVYFRFSRKQDVSTLSALDSSATIHFASMDEDADDYGELSSLEYYTRTSRGRYICQNWLAVSVFPGRPLLANHTYAVWLTKGITSDEGEEIVRDEDFKTMMHDERPEDVNGGRAWDAYSSYRAFVDAEGLTRGEIVSATVFSTGDTQRGVRYFREVADTADSPIAVTEEAACGASSCGGTCGTGAGFVEFHGRVTIPNYRGGDGGIVYDEANLRPKQQSTESACFAVTIPQGEAPVSGWPVVVYGADVGDGFNSFALDGIAEAFATRGIAMIGMDLPGHGGRATGEDPVSAWWTMGDPVRLRGTELQEIADLHSALRLATEYAHDGVSFDAANLWFVGGGEGADAGAAFMTWSMDLRGGVLANPNGHRVLEFSGRGDPFDVEHALQAAMADSALSRWHPIGSLVQQWVDPADPVNQAEGMLYSSPTIAKHVLVLHGVDDEEVPSSSIEAFLRASYLPTAGAILDDYGQTTTAVPAWENIGSPDGRRTGVVIQVEAGHSPLSGPALDTAADFVATGLTGSPTAGK